MEQILEIILMKEVIFPLIYILASIIIYLVAKKILKATIFLRVRGTKAEKKAKTVYSLLSNILKYIIGFIAIAAILSVYGVNVTSLLAGAGIVGIVIGFSLQDVLKDILSGISIITENQYEVGDIIQIGTYKGEVIALSLKTTRIKNNKGDIKIIANRNITEIINYSFSDSVAIVKISLLTNKKTEEVEKTLEEISIKIKEKLTNTKGEIRIVSDMTTEKGKYNYYFEVNVNATKEEKVEKEMLKNIKKILETENLESYTLTGDSND